jgi:hypothetical protein
MYLVIVLFVNDHEHKITDHGKTNREQHLVDHREKKNGQNAVQKKI